MKQILIRAIINSFRRLSFISPKKKGLLVFSPWHNRPRLSGDIKSLLRYAAKNYKGDIVLIHSRTEDSTILRNKNIKIAKNLFSTYWNLARAELVIIDASIPPYANWNLSIIQLWHGVGFKKVGLLNRHNISKPDLYKKLKRHYRQYVLVTAASKDDAEKKNKAFETNVTTITGSPRNDIFFNGSSRRFSDVQNKYKIQEYSNIISYTPTYRDFKTLEPFSNAFWKALNNYLVNTNTLFIIKKHPWDKYLIPPTHYDHIKDFSTKIDDVQELLTITDLLISDYSSISTDFSITGKPILFYMYDLEKYLESSRSFYYDLEEILPKPFVYKEQALLDKIRDQSWVQAEEYQESYQNFRNRFHKYLDGNSSQRVFEAMKNIQK